MKHKKTIKYRNRLKSRLIYFYSLLFLLFSHAEQVYANSEEGANKIADSKFGKGTIALLNDTSLFLLILSPSVGAVLGIYFFMRKNAADEQDQKQWNKRLITTGVCVVGAVLVSALINVVTGYYK